MSDIRDLISDARVRAKHDPQTAAGILRGRKEVIDAGLDDLFYLLDRGEYGVSKNDVIGAIELLEKWLDEQGAQQ